MFDIDKWVEERKARWAEITAMGRDINNYNVHEILGMTEEEYQEFINSTDSNTDSDNE